MRAGWCGIGGLAVVALTIATCVYAGVYKEGKMVSGRDSEVDIMKMKWGKLDTERDRIIGTVRVYDQRVVQHPYDHTFALTFDFNDKAGQRLDSLETTFSFKTYGYITRGLYVEGEFCVDLDVNPERRRVNLVNVKIGGEPVKYQTKFNISPSLMRTGFTLPKPKVVPMPTR